MKDYEGPEHEIEQVLQMAVSEVASEDPRFLEKEAPPLSEEFPAGSKVFFLGEHAYGVAAQVSETTKDNLSIVLAVSPLHISTSITITHCLISFSLRNKLKTSSSRTSLPTVLLTNTTLPLR